MKNTWKISGGKIRAVVFFAFMCVMVPSIVPSVCAEESGFQFGRENALKTNLQQFKGKTIEIHLKSGGQLVGKLSEVGTQSILLKELRGKEYYDALIVIDDIAAVIFKAR
jgi:hypothetical protein